MRTQRSRPLLHSPRRERGSFLLEALVAMLIVALGVLGCVGLLARSMQDVDDAKFRGEAAYLANSMIGQMWLDDRAIASLTAKYGAKGGAGFDEYASLIAQRLPNASLSDVDIVAGPTPTSTQVTVTITWHLPGDTAGMPDHHHIASATIGAN